MLLNYGALCLDVQFDWPTYLNTVRWDCNKDHKEEDTIQFTEYRKFSIFGMWWYEYNPHGGERRRKRRQGM